MVGEKSVFDLSLESFPTGHCERQDTGLDWLYGCTVLLYDIMWLLLRPI